MVKKHFFFPQFVGRRVKIALAVPFALRPRARLRVHAAGHWNGFASAIFRPRRFAALVSGADPAVGSCGLRVFFENTLSISEL